jgi:putative DNA-invertase from lambdoid prophage Rac
VTVAALYVRVSTDKQTLENQTRELERVALQRGLTPLVYDETVSGAKRRPRLEQVVADARAGKVGVVLVVALDRLGRSMLDVVQTVLELERYGAHVISLREPWLDGTGPTRNLLLAIFGWVAEQERAMLIARTRAGLDRARAAGARIGRPPSNPILIGAATRKVDAGASIRSAARDLGVSPTSLRRALKARQKGSQGASRASHEVPHT